MMLSIYTTENIIASIYKDSEDKYVAWYNLIKKARPNIKVLLDRDSDYDTNDYNPVYMLGKDYDLDVKPEYPEEVGDNSYIGNVTSLQPKTILDPCAIFILEVDKETAIRISRKYGVICHSFEESPVENPIFQEEVEINIESREDNRSWGELISSEVTTPSNFLIFIDRYLFAEDRSSSATRDVGYENIFELLNDALPETLEVEFHVLFIFDISSLKLSEPELKQTFEEISTKLYRLKKKVNRNYNIIIEGLSVSKNDFNYRDDLQYAETHNRRILSNYYMIKAEHSLKAFRNKKGLYSQSLSLDWLASKGIVRQRRSDIPAKSLYRTLKEIKEVIVKFRGYKRDILFFQNGRAGVPIENIVHRLQNYTTKK